MTGMLTAPAMYESSFRYAKNSNSIACALKIADSSELLFGGAKRWDTRLIESGA